MLLWRQLFGLSFSDLLSEPVGTLSVLTFLVFKQTSDTSGILSKPVTFWYLSNMGDIVRLRAYAKQIIL